MCVKSFKLKRAAAAVGAAFTIFSISCRPVLSHTNVARDVVYDSEMCVYAEFSHRRRSLVVHAIACMLSVTASRSCHKEKEEVKTKSPG